MKFQLSNLLRTLLFACSVFAITVCSFAAAHSPSLDDAAKILGPGEHIGVILMLDNRVHMDDIYPVVRYMPMPERRAFVIKTLKERYAMMGGEVERFLQNERKMSRVSLLRPLWIMNAIRVRMAPELIAQIDKYYPEVYYILNDAAYDNTLDDQGWGVDSVNALEVWRDFGANGADVIVGHKDGGCHYNLPVFAGKIWINPGEDLNHNGELDDSDRDQIDNDGNGYIDDFRGWEFDGDTNDPDDSGASACHGTRTASVVSSVLANRNSCDTVAVAPGAKLMILRGFIYQGAVFESSQYALEMGAQVITASLSFKQNDCDQYRDCPNYVCHRMVSEMELAAGMIHSNSTGNDGLSNPVPLSCPAPSNSPPPAMTPGHEQQGGVSSIVSVGGYLVGNQYYTQGGHGPAGWSHDDICVHERMAFCGPGQYPAEYEDYPYQNSAFPGLAKPDVASPVGSAAFGCSGECTSIGGTSGATPVVGGCLALIYSAFPGITPEDAYLYLISSVQDSGIAGWDSLWGFGMVRPYPAIQQGFGQRGTVSGPITAEGGVPISGVQVWSAGDLSRTVYTDENGIYYLNLPAGEQTLYFRKYGYTQIAGATVVVAGDTVTLSQRLNQAEMSTVVFNIRYNTNTAIANMPVSIPEAGLEGFSNDSGELIFANMYASTIVYRAGALPYEAVERTITIASGVQNITVNLERSPIGDPTGPDAEGLYYVYDSYDFNGPTYDWVEINPNDGGLPGQALSPQDNGAVAVTLPFTFRYYNSDYTQVRVHRNGFIIFGTETSSEWGPYPIPQQSEPNNFIAPFFYDWIVNAGSSVWFYSDAANHQAIFEWYDILDFPQTGIARFQCILLDPAFYPTQSTNGQIIYQYHTLNGRYEGVIGLENSDGTAGVEYVFQTHYDEHAAPVAESTALLISTDLITKADEQAHPLPERFVLNPNFPNPFNPSTTFSWTAPRAAHVRLALFDILGREAAIVYDGMSSAGAQTIEFNAAELATGIYFAKLEVEGSAAGIQKVMLLK